MSKIIKVIYIIFLFVVVFSINNIFGQEDVPEAEKESPNYTATSYYLIEDVWNTNKTDIEPDTLLIDFVFFDPINNGNFMSASLGAFGHNHRILDITPLSLEQNFRNIHYNHFLQNRSNFKIYNTSSPFSRLYFATGIPKLQYFGGTHAQSVKNFNFGVDFQVINSLGTYQRQRVTMGSASTYLKYVTNNKKYGILASFQFNQFTAQENGGIADDSLFTYNEEPFRPGMPININTKAENKYLDNEFALTHYFDFLAKNDSTISKFTFGKIIHNLQISKQKWLYLEEEVDPFQRPVTHTSLDNTYDSTLFRKISNSLEMENKINFRLHKKENFIGLNFGLKNEIYTIGDYFYKSQINSYTPFLKAYTKIADLNISANYHQMFTHNENAKNDLSLKLSYNIKEHLFSFSYNNINAQADLFYFNYHANYNQWDLPAENSSFNSISFSYKNKFFDGGISSQHIANYVYLNHLAQPTVYDENISLLKSWADFSWTYKILHSQTKLSLHTSNADSILMLPTYTVRERFYFVFYMFKKAMLANAGFELSYIPEYYGAYYSPELMDFYLNNEHKIGNFLMLDIFIGFKVKRLNLFAKMSNAPQGILPYNYFGTPHYPLQDRNFSLGFSWRFYD